ncbi:MAG: hypothetical protein AAGB12_13030 [Pseudomonadota bacterium]
MFATTALSICLSLWLYLFSVSLSAQSFLSFEPIKTFYQAPTLSLFGNLAIDDRGHLCTSAKNQGLHCYDGIHMHTLHDGDIAGIVANNDQVFGATRHKVFRLSQGALTFLPEYLQPELEVEEKITQIFADDYSDFLVQTNRGVYRVHSDHVEALYRSTSETIHFVASHDTPEMLWISSTNGLFLYNTTNQEKNILFNEALVYEMTPELYLTNKGLYQRDSNQLLFEGEFFRSLSLANGDLLIAGQSGICRLRNLEALDCGTSFANPAADDNIIAYSLLSDNYGNLFAATNNGLYVSQPSFYQNFSEGHGLLSKRVLSLLEVDNALYVGTSAGLNVFDLQASEFTTVEGTQDMAVNSIQQIDDSLWLGVTGEGVYQFSLITKELKKIITADSHIFSIVSVGGVVYLGVENQGLFKYDKAGQLLLSRQQKHFRKIRQIAVCNDYLLIGTMMDGMIKLNSELVFEDYIRSTDLHTFICQEDQIIAGSLTGELLTLDEHLQVQNTFENENSIYTLLPYGGSFITLNEKGLYFGENDNLVIMPMPTYINVAKIVDDELYFGGTQGLFRVNLQAAKDFEAAVPMLNLTVKDTDLGQLLNLRTQNIIQSHQYEWFLSFDNKNFMALPNNDPFISRENQASVFVYLKDTRGQSTPVQEIALIQPSGFLSLDTRFLYFLAGMTFLTLIYVAIRYSPALIMSYIEKSSSAPSNLLPSETVVLANHAQEVLSTDVVESSLAKNTELDDESDDEQVRLNLEAVRQFVLKDDKRQHTDYHKMRIAKFNALLREEQRYLQAKEIAAAIGLSENQIRFSLKTLFGNGSIKSYIPIYLDIVQQEESYEIG